MRSILVRAVAPGLAAALAAGCSSPQDENAGRDDPAPSARASASETSAAGARPTTPPTRRSYPAPSPATVRVGQSFTAAILADGAWIKARVTLTAIDGYDEKDFPELDGTALLFRWRATNVDDHPLTAERDPVGYRFAGLDASERRTTPSGYAHGSASSPDGCTSPPAKLVWKPGRTVRGCVVQTVARGSRLERAAFLSGDPRNPQAVEFDLSVD